MTAEQRLLATSPAKDYDAWRRAMLELGYETIQRAKGFDIDGRPMNMIEAQAVLFYRRWGLGPLVDRWCEAFQKWIDTMVEDSDHVEGA